MIVNMTQAEMMLISLIELKKSKLPISILIPMQYNINVLSSFVNKTNASTEKLIEEYVEHDENGNLSYSKEENGNLSFEIKDEKREEFQKKLNKIQNIDLEIKKIRLSDLKKVDSFEKYHAFSMEEYANITFMIEQ